MTARSAVGPVLALLLAGACWTTEARAAAPGDPTESDGDRGASSQDTRATELARTTFNQARDAFARKSYVAAASAFEQSASYVPHPAPWINAAEAWILSGDPVRAARACDRALAFEDIDAATRTQASERLRKVLPLVGTVELESASPVTVRVGEASHPLPVRLRLAPATHAFVMTNGSAELRWSLDLRAGAHVKRAIFLREGKLHLGPAGREPDGDAGSRVAQPPPGVSAGATSKSADRPSASTGPRAGIPILSVIGYGVAAAATGAAVYFGASTLDARERWRDTAADDARGDFYRDRALTNVSLGVAVVAVVASTVFWLSSGRPR